MGALLTPQFLTALQIRAVISGDANIAALLSANLRAPQTTPAAAIPVGASPFVYSNATQFVQQVVVSGGTVSSIALSRGGNMGETFGAWLLVPGDSITVTYSVAPTNFTATNLI
jgi:hypothetical protein